MAALWVVAYHCWTMRSGILLPYFPSKGIVAHGWISVDVFFILSGFVLMSAHSDDFRSIRYPALRDFAVQRFLRVYPLSAIALLMVAAMVLCDRSYGHDFGLPGFLRTLALADRWTAVTADLSPGWNDVTWSLSEEVMGYAMFPLAAWSACRARADVALLGGAASILTLVYMNWRFGFTNVNNVDNFGFIRMVCGFGCGIGLARFRTLCRVDAYGLSAPAALASASVLAWACSGVAYMSLALPSAAVLILSLSYGGGVVGRLLSSRVALWLGAISFPLYLIHLTPLSWLTAKVAPYDLTAVPTMALQFAFVVVAVAVAHGMHRSLELPIQAFSRRVVKAMRAGRVGTVGTSVHATA